MDDTATPFTSDYVTPAWKSGDVEIIPPSKEPVTETPWNETPCVGLSFSYPDWDVQDFTYEEGEASFRLNNHGNNGSVACAVQEGDWSDCGDNSTSVRYVEQTGELSVNQTWVCNGGEKYPHEYASLLLT